MPHLAEPAAEDSPGHTTVAWLHPAGKTPCEFQGWSPGPNPGRAQEGSWPGSHYSLCRGRSESARPCQVSLREDTLVWDWQELGSGCARDQRKREAGGVLGWGGCAGKVDGKKNPVPPLGFLPTVDVWDVEPTQTPLQGGVSGGPWGGGACPFLGVS